MLKFNKILWLYTNLALQPKVFHSLPIPPLSASYFLSA